MKGFTLLEVLIATVLFTVGVVLLAGLFSTGLLSSADTENTEIAINLAQQRMEEIRNLDFGTGIVYESKATVSGFPGFQRAVTVTEPETNLKQVAVIVYWTSQSGEADISLVTYVSKN